MSAIDQEMLRGVVEKVLADLGKVTASSHRPSRPAGNPAPAPVQQRVLLHLDAPWTVPRQPFETRAYQPLAEVSVE